LRTTGFSGFSEGVVVDSTLQRPQLVGNRIVLVGAVLYLLEWVAIITGNISAPVGADHSASAALAAYAGHAQTFGWAAGWFSVVLLGRVLIVAGLRTALRDSGRPQPLMDVAVAAMAVGVAVEVATYALVAGLSWLAAHGGTAAQLRALDAGAFYLNQMVWGPSGVALLCCAIAMWRSGLFPRALTGLGLLSGAVLVLVAVALQAPRFAGLSDALTSVAVLFWVWMLWTGVLLWTRTARPAERAVGTSAV
jgi:hypothetical protein